MTMRRFLLALGALCWSGCGSDAATIVPAGAGGSTGATAGSGGEPTGAAGDGAGGSATGEGGTGGASAGSDTGGTETGGSGTGNGGAAASGGASDIIDVDDGDFAMGEPPPPSGSEALPQILQVTGPTAVTNGGTAILHIQVSPPIASPTFVIGLEGDTGYHTVTGADPDADGVYDVSVQVAGEASQASLVLSVALEDALGNVGEYHSLTIELVRSGTGDVKVTLSFDRVHDLDLHVIEPNGEEISFANDASATGGQLDLDSGSHCVPSSANAENIFWPPNGAPAGTYRVTVQNYEQCSPGDIAFTVRVAYDNVVNTYTGSFPDGTASDVPSANNVREIASFTRGIVPP